MFRELLSVFHSDDSLARIETEFSDMLKRSQLLTVKAGGHFFEGTLTAEEQEDFRAEDKRINELETAIRKEVVTRLTLGMPSHQLPYALLVMSLAADAERIGDHAKALAAVRRDLSAELPREAAGLPELRKIRRNVEAVFGEVEGIFAGAESDRAREVIGVCQDTRVDAEALIGTVAQGTLPAPQTTALVLAANHYAHIAAHLTRILSGVVLPLHELDLYDEDLLEGLSAEEGGTPD